MIPTRSTDRHLIEAANRFYHEAEATLYDQSHPEILWCERIHWDAFAKAYVAGMSSPRSILDIGAGTGFVGSVLVPYLQPEDRYVATDLSSNMLKQLQGNLHGAGCQVEALVAPADVLPFTDGIFDMVVINSAMHHFPDVEGSLREASRVLRSGGILAIMHEPNLRFACSARARQTARVASILAYKLDRPTKPVEKPDYSPVFHHVNERLMAEGITHEKLSNAEIQALVDVHSPTARGGIEEVGLNPLAWQKTIFHDWNVLEFKTYNHLGKLDPTVATWRKYFERACSIFFPREGYLFSLIVRKP